jgi:hypothetical protein
VHRRGQEEKKEGEKGCGCADLSMLFPGTATDPIDGAGSLSCISKPQLKVVLTSGL